MDLRSRWNALLLVLALTPLFGCMVLDASPHQTPATGLAAGKTTMNFGSVVVGDYTVVSDTLQNSSSSSITISSATVSGDEYSISSPSFPMTLAPGQQTTLSVTFAPTSAGQPTGSIVLANDGPTSSVTLSLAGTAVAPGVLAANPASISFGTVMVGKSQTLTETFTNAGGTNLTISQATPSASYFQVSGLTLPLTLKPNQNANFSVTFTPASSGAASGTIQVATQAAGWAHGRRGRYHRAGAGVATLAEVRASAADGADEAVTIPLSGMANNAGQLTSTASLSFGSTTVGKSQTLAASLTNSGGSSVSVSQATVTGTGFSVTGLSLPLTLAAGQTTSFNVVFTPQSAGNASGNVAISSNASNSTVNTGLTGTGVAAGALAASPASVSFGSVQTGSSQSASETLTNSGGSSVTITQATATGSGFSVSGISLPVTLAAGQSTSFSIAFAPQSSGAASGNLSITSNASNTSLSVALAGTGVTAGTLAASPVSVSFGSVQTGTNKTASETLTNSGGSSVTITQATATGSGFSVSGISLPVTLTAGQSTSFSLAFAPQSSGAVSGNLSVTSNASNTSLSVALAGTGVTAGALAASPVSVSFGSVQTGTSQSASETLTNSGGSSVTITQATATGSGFSVSGISLPVTLAAGQSTSFSIAFAPQSSGAASGNLSITSNASNSSLGIGLSGTGLAPGTLADTQSSLSFGSIQVGSSTTASETITNTGGASVTISQVSVTGTGFSAPGLDLPLTLTAGQSFTFSAMFAPQAAGAVTGGISVISNASNATLAISLSGTGTASGQLTLSPSTLSFGNVNVGASQTLTGSLSATGASVTISSGVPSTSEFVLSGVSFPLTIAAGHSASFTMTFTPQASGAAAATATFASNASNTPGVESLTGTGVAAAQHQVALTWDASSSSVVGYNVYRGAAASGPYTKINSASDVSTSYTDSAVTAGQTYYYLTTAVDSEGVESTYSNEVSATIPTP